MFTGLVETVGRIQSIVDQMPSVQLEIDASIFDQEMRVGDSIAINGCCLTAVRVQNGRAAFQAGEETLKRTNLGFLRVGDPVNLERAMRSDSRLGGHIVTGHIDTLATVRTRRDDQDWSFMEFDLPEEYLAQVVSKGSIAIDGVSLTVVEVDKTGFSVALIPHTLSVTTLGGRVVGDVVNIETDLLAKYVQKQLAAWNRNG